MRTGRLLLHSVPAPFQSRIYQAVNLGAHRLLLETSSERVSVMQTSRASPKTSLWGERAAVGELLYSAGEAAPSFLVTESFSTPDTANTRVSQPLFEHIMKGKGKGKRKGKGKESSLLSPQ